MFLAFGEIMARIATPGKQRWCQSLPGPVQVTWGGGEANVCASLAILGNRTRYVTAVPKQPLAFAMRDSLRALGIDTDSILWKDSGRLGLYFVEAGANQRGSTVVYDREHTAISEARVEEYGFSNVLKGVRWLHVTGITPAISRSAFEANRDLVRLAKEQGATVSCDLNFRKKLWRWDETKQPRELAQESMAQILPSVDVVIGNEEDAADVLDIHAEGTNVDQGKINAESYFSVARQICEKFGNVRQVAITLRESLSASHNNWGGLLYDRKTDSGHLAPVDEGGSYRPYQITHIVDRIGAGDSFAAGLLHCLQREPTSFQNAIEFAVAASCLKHSVPGDFNFVTEDEIELLKKGNASGRVQR